MGSSRSKTGYRGTRGTQKSRHSNKQRESSTSPNYGPGYRRDSGYPRHSRRSRSRSRSRSPFPSARRDSNASTVPELAGSPQNSKTSHDHPRTSSLIDVSPIIANKGLQLPQSSTSSATIPRPMSPKTQQGASSSINQTPSLHATASQTGKLGDLPFSSSRPLVAIPWQPRAMRPTPPTQPPQPLPMQSLPTVPSALSAGMAPSTTVEQTPEEKRALWEERTR